MEKKSKWKKGQYLVKSKNKWFERQILGVFSVMSRDATVIGTLASGGADSNWGGEVELLTSR